MCRANWKHVTNRKRYEQIKRLWITTLCDFICIRIYAYVALCAPCAGTWAWTRMAWPTTSSCDVASGSGQESLQGGYGRTLWDLDPSWCHVVHQVSWISMAINYISIAVAHVAPRTPDSRALLDAEFSVLPFCLSSCHAIMLSWHDLWWESLNVIDFSTIHSFELSSLSCGNPLLTVLVQGCWKTALTSWTGIRDGAPATERLFLQLLSPER